MAVSVFSPGLINAGTLDTLIATGSMNALANAGFALGVGQETNNVPVDGTTPAGDLIWPVLNFATAITVGAGSPNIVLYALRSTDGTTYPAPPGTVAAAAPLGLSIATQAVASVSTTQIPLNPVPLDALKYRWQIQNNLGTAFPATGVTLTGQRTLIKNY